MENKIDVTEYDLLAPMKHADRRNFTHVHGAAYTDDAGKSYIDLNEMCAVLGQGNQAYIQAVVEALNGVTTDKAGFSPAKERLYHYIIDTTHGDFEAIHLTSSGSEAVEWAIRLAKRITGRSEIVSFWNSIHGRTYLSASISGLPKRKEGYGPLAPGVISVPYPHCAACRDKDRCANGVFYCLERAKEQYKYGTAHDGAAIIAEPYLGVNIAIPPKGYWSALAQWAKSEGMLFIMDEIQSGMGRTGEMYCYQREHIVPDMLLLGKALGGGLHINALLVKNKPDPQFLPAVSGGVGDEAVACAAACEVFRQLEGGLLAHIQKVSAALEKGLRRMSQSAKVLEVRSLGLLAAIEFYNAEDAGRVAAILAEKGFYVGRNEAVIFIKPPYVITDQQIDFFLIALDGALNAC